MSRETVQLWINGASVVVPAGASVAAAIAQSLEVGAPFRRSRSGTPRTPLCGMGVCFECGVEIDGTPQQRACMTLARAAMQVRTDD
jgi:sarcosine oxidase subunit alpha